MNPTAFHVLAKPTGPLCNLDCKYCFYLEKDTLYPSTAKWMMADDVLESFIRQYIEQQEANEVHFAWQGGEPTLLGIDYFRKIVLLQEKYSLGKSITNAFQTNGILLNDDWGRFLHDHLFLVGLSIDGPRELHDGYRVDKGGNPTFDKVMRGLQVLERNAVSFNTLTTVHRKNMRHGLEVYRFLKDAGSQYMQFIPIVERAAFQANKTGLILVAPSFGRNAKVSQWSVEPKQYGRFLCTIFDEWVRNDVGKIFVQLFDVALQAWVGQEPGLCVFRRQCGHAMAIEHNGDLYSCDHFVYPEYRLGNIMDVPVGELAASEQQVRFGKDKEEALPKYCMACDVRFACNGECPKHRFLETPDGEPGLNYLCEGYKKFFHHVDPHMRFMVNELHDGRPPANIMPYIRARDRTDATPGRNDLCPCGSGRKFKRCCGKSAQ